MMKQFLLFFCITVFLLFSCNRKEENNNEEQKNILLENQTGQYFPNEKGNIEINKIIDIFSFDIFENIGETIEYYETQPDFSITDISKPREREVPDKEIIASNDELIVHFIRWRGNENEYRYVEVLLTTENNIFGKYIGLTGEEIIETFGPERRPSHWHRLGILAYIDFDLQLFVEFYFDINDKKKIINKIIYGHLDAVP